jgi:hypothetical protein
MSLSSRKPACPLIAALLLALGATPHLLSQTNTSQPPPLSPTAPTLSLGEALRKAKLESDVPEVKYQNGFFISKDRRSHVQVHDKDGHLTGDFTLLPQSTDIIEGLFDIGDVAIDKDGSIMASFAWTSKLDGLKRNHYLVHFDPAGNFLEQIDLGLWRPTKICIAKDKSIWTLSEEEQFGHSVYSPEEGVLRNYKFGSGLVQAVVPRSNFPYNHSNGSWTAFNSALDSSGEKIHALVSGYNPSGEEAQWIEYTPGADFTITKVESLSRAAFGGFWRLTGFAFLGENHAYAILHSGTGDPFKRVLAELLPTKDGKTLQWVEVPPEKTLPANNQPSVLPPPGPDSAAKPKEPIMVIGLFGADHEDSEQLVYRTSAGETVLWSKPLFNIPVTQSDSAPVPAPVSAPQ